MRLYGTALPAIPSIKGAKVFATGARAFKNNFVLPLALVFSKTILFATGARCGCYAGKSLEALLSWDLNFSLPAPHEIRTLYPTRQLKTVDTSTEK